MLWWNGEPLPIPSGPIEYSYRDIEGTNSGQTLGGSYSKKVIAKKEDLLVSWAGLSAAEAAVVAKIKNSTYGKLTYYSPKKGCFVSGNFYTEDLSQQLNSAELKHGYLEGDFSCMLQFRMR